MFIGNRKIWDFFEQVIDKGNIGQAYCFVGADGVGKRTMARQLAARLLDTTVEKLTGNPDYIAVERLEDDEGYLKKDVSKKQTDGLISRLRNRSWGGGYHIAVINEAETMNKTSANSLLKTLEEPSEKGLIFLLTENDQTLLPTIRSRVQMLYFAPVSQSEIEAGLCELGLGESAAELAKLSAGRPGLAIQMANDPESIKKWRAEYERWQKMIGQPFYIKIKLIEDMFGDKEDNVRGRQHLRKIIDWWIGFWRLEILDRAKNNGGESRIGKMDDKQVVRIIDGLARTKELLARNAHPRLVMEQAIFDI